MNRLLTLVLIATATVSQAQEVTSEYQFFGFSSDLKYAAFETFIPPPVEDAAPVSKIIFVDIDKNSWPTKPLTASGKATQTMEAVRAMNFKNAAPLFAKYGITPNSNVGTKLTLNREKDDFLRIVALNVQNFTANGVKYKIVLKEIGTGKKHPYFEEIEEKMLDLSVVYNGKTQILQKDKSVPASRGFVKGYSIVDAFVNGNKIVLIVEYRNHGFEGYPDTYHMIVTGVLGK